MSDIVERLRERYPELEIDTDRLSVGWEAADEIKRLREDAGLTLREATRLLESFAAEHCQPIPEWAPLPDLIGVLSQLSNAVTVARDYKDEIERHRAEADISDGLLADAKAENERLLDACKDKTALLQDAYAQNERLLAREAQAKAIILLAYVYVPHHGGWPAAWHRDADKWVGV